MHVYRILPTKYLVKYMVTLNWILDTEISLLTFNTKLCTNYSVMLFVENPKVVDTSKLQGFGLVRSSCLFFDIVNTSSSVEIPSICYLLGAYCNLILSDSA